MLEKSKLKKLKNQPLEDVAQRICDAVVRSKMEEEILHPLFLKMQELTNSFFQNLFKNYRSEYETKVMAAEQTLKRVYRSFYQQLLSKASDLDPTTAQAAKVLLKKSKYTASAFERLKQEDKLCEIYNLTLLLRYEDYSQPVALTVSPDMVDQLDACCKELHDHISNRSSDKRELRKSPTATKLRTPLIDAIHKYYPHLYIKNETEAVEESVNLMLLIKYIVDHGGTRKYVFKTRKPAAPKVKKRKKKKPIL